MSAHPIVDQADWLAARRELLAEEKAYLRSGDALAEKRRALPWVRIDKEYVFDTVRGRESLADLFAGKGQLILYHFMFGADWQQGCPSCSFWADNFDGVDVHLLARDTAFRCASNAPLDRLQAYRRRMGWRFDWVSAEDAAFSIDFGATFPDKRPGPLGGYNYTDAVRSDELPGISAFVRLDDGGVAHTYSTYARGVEAANGAYRLLDLTAKGRDEAGLSGTQTWVRRRDEY